MKNKITIDSAGRIVIPKAVRNSLQLMPGDALELDTTADGITLRPARDTVALVKEEGVWVYRTGVKLTQEAVADLIEQVRNDRMKDILG